MKLLLFCCAILTALPLTAQSLRNAGILGNSGEQGATLVRFAEKQTVGMGVVYDRFGTLWDRAGDGRLNRYAPDGRLLGSWDIPPRKPTHLSDSIILIGDTLLFSQERKLYTFPIDATADTKPKLLPVEVTQLSINSHNGWVAAARDGEVFLVNLSGETKPVAKVTERLFDVEVGPEGGVYARIMINKEHRVVRLDAAALKSEDRVSWDATGDRLQWLNGHWFGHAGHGTIRRFSPDFQPDPGVVLGGNSGSFIGYVPGNYDLLSGLGLAHLGDSLYAVSGRFGIMHLLEWVETDRRFEIIRRIGAVPSCAALAIDGAGRVWYNGGMWEWSDGPDVPLRHGVPVPGAPGFVGAAVLDNGSLAAVSGSGVAYGKLDGPVTRRGLPSGFTNRAVTATVVTRDKRQVLIAVDATGNGSVVNVNSIGEPQGTARPVVLNAASPLQEITSISAGVDGVLFVAADGQMVEFAPEADGWREKRRWNSWGAAPVARLGGRVFSAVSEGRIWISDTEKHRVLCFDISGERPVPVAAFGIAGQTGDDLGTLNRPETIAVSGSRAVVFDSGNQRLVRLELESTR